MTTYVIVHGAWHTGAHFETTAAGLRAAGHEVHLPTLAGNGPGDDRSSGLDQAVDSLLEFLDHRQLRDFVLVGHSYGGMAITVAADRLGSRIRRLVYWNAFVPLNGESLADLVPPHFVGLFSELAAADGGVTLPYRLWRDAFMNDAPAELAQSSYASLNPHPIRTLTDPVRLACAPAAFECGKSYLNATADTALPQSLGWHPRLSERLGLFRLVQSAGGHELCFSNPELLAQKIELAGRD